MIFKAHAAAVHGHAAVLGVLAGRADLALANRDGDEPVHVAAAEGHAAAVPAVHSTEMPYAKPGSGKCEVEALAPRARARSRGQGDSPLHYAAYEGHLPALEALLAHGADPEAPNELGDTPAHVAAMGGHTAAMALLSAPGAVREGNEKDKREGSLTARNLRGVDNDVRNYDLNCCWKRVRNV